MADAANKPCLVEAGQGFSILYQNRHLYSRFAPQKAILQAVANLTILPGTLIICASPCLWYGMAELLAKLPDGCHILALEADKELEKLSLTELTKQAFRADSRLHILPADAWAEGGKAAAYALAELVQAGGKSEKSLLPRLQTFRRAILVEMSGGSTLHKASYQAAAYGAESVIATFWKNRLTLTRFGRLYARNVFRNLCRQEESSPLASLLGSVHKPILLFGAGESAEATLEALPRSLFSRAFILAVDAALPLLSARGIAADGLVAVESQLAIEKAYIGNPRRVPLLLADLVSRPAVTCHHAAGGRVSFFLSAYTDAAFIRDLDEKNLLPPQVPPLGSVGLTATYLALHLRADESIPVFVTGLDFSYSLGATHARGAPAHTARLTKANRLQPLANIDAAFKNGAKTVPGKKGAVITDVALSGYAGQFAETFTAIKNLYDAGESGLPLSLPRVSSIQLATYLASAPVLPTQSAPSSQAGAAAPGSPDFRSRLTAYLKQEHDALFRLKTLLIQGEAARSPAMTVQEEITALLTPRDYLYLHFPDGYTCRPQDVDFLKRVRSEIDFFLKDISISR